MTAPPRIGFVGLGKMGLPMASRLVDAEWVVTGFDVADAGRDAFGAAGGIVADGLSAVTDGADILILMLPDSRVVDAVLSDEMLRTHLRAGSIVIDMSSSEPVVTRGLAAQLDAQGVQLVDAPVSGGVKGATAGTLTVMAGGSVGAFARVRPVLEVLGTPMHVGPVGSGHAIKALNNLLSATHLWITSEAMIAGERFGLDPNVMLDVFNGSSGRSGSTENKWPNFILPGTYDSGFGLRLMLKDMRIAVALAEQVGAPSRLGEDAVRFWSEAADSLAASSDHTEVAKWLRSKGGLG